MSAKKKGKKEKREASKTKQLQVTSDELKEDGCHTYEELLALCKALEQKDVEKSIEIAR